MNDRRHTVSSGGGARSPRSARSTRPAYFCLLSAFICLLITFILLLSSCTSPTPPPPPPPPAGPDTTSHEFIWQIDTLGDGNSSVLYDVAIINDTTIWAVGEIYLKDSTGQVDPDAYNLAKWNGRMWSYERVMYPFGGAWFNAPLHSVFALKQDDVWVGSNQPMHWNGVSWRTFDLGSDTWNGWINKIWANADAGTYLVGNGGAIAHFDGTTWRRIESGTISSLTDVVGVQGIGGSTPFVCIVAADLFVAGASRILTIQDGTISDTAFGLPPFTPYSVWSDPVGSVVASGEGLWRRTGSEWTRELEPIFLNRVRGTASNSVFTAGSRFMVFHYNGSSWHRYSQLERPNAVWRGLDARGSQVVAVGDVGSTVVVVRGKRPD